MSRMTDRNIDLLVLIFTEMDNVDSSLVSISRWTEDTILKILHMNFAIGSFYVILFWDAQSIKQHYEMCVLSEKNNIYNR